MPNKTNQPLLFVFIFITFFEMMEFWFLVLIVLVSAISFSSFKYNVHVRF